jgi:uncharacterized iron-regulated protein
MRFIGAIAIRSCLPAIFLLGAACTAPDAARHSFWIDMYEGEPIAYPDLLDDLADVRVIYLGESHTVDRHHAMQHRIVTDLAERGIPLVLAIEQMEACYQPALDEYNSGAIDFDQLAKRTDWPKRWSNYQDYRQTVESAHQSGAPILALNAKAEVVRQVARKGIDGLDPEERSQLPAKMNLDDPMYEGKLNRLMMVHAGVMKDMVHRMFEAQVSRDETMAENLCAFLKTNDGKNRTAVVLCGSGHVSHGLGIPSRVRSRMPGVKDRVIVMSASGDVELSDKMRAMAREITITHEQMRDLDRPIADYLLATNLKQAAE